MKSWIFVISFLVASFGYAQDDMVNRTDVKQDDIRGAVRYADKELSLEHYSSNLQLRDDRKVGVGTQVGGGLGIAGLNLEVIVDNLNSVVAGAGAGSGYGTFQVLWKHVWEGRYFTPYTTAGWSRWYNSDSSDSYKKSSVLNLALTDSQKDSGRFGVDFLTGSLGMQYQELSGEFAGTSFYVEFTALTAFQSPSLIPSGAIGAIYYF